MTFDEVITKGHSFPWNTEVWAELWNLPVSTEFLRFRRILYWWVIKGVHWSGLGGRRKLITIFRHDCHSSSNLRNIANIELIWIIAFLFGIQTVAVGCDNLPATNTVYLVGCRGHRKLIAIRGKFGKLARGIGKNWPRKTVVPTYHNHKKADVSPRHSVYAVIVHVL